MTLALGLMCVIAGCAGGLDASRQVAPAASTPAGATHNAAGYRLTVLPETFLGVAPQGEFSLDVSNSDGATVVRVLGTGLRDLRAFYARLDCPPGVALDQTQAGSGLGAADDVLSLCHGAPGVVHLGALLKHCDRRAGVSGAAELARAVLRPGAAALRQASDVIDTVAVHPVLRVNCTTRRIEWDTRLTGDYNQDGIIGVADLTPLAVHWEAPAVLHPDSITRYVVDSIQEVVDGNADEQINISDLVAIGIGFDTRIAGWNLYRSLDPEQDFPAVDLDDPQGDGAVPSKITRFAYRAYAALAEGDPAHERRRFGIDLPLLADGMAYWVRPVSGGAEGTPSNWSPYDASLAQEIAWDTNVETYTGCSTGTLDFELRTLGADVIEGVLWAHGVDALRILSGHCHFDGMQYDPTAYSEGRMARDLADRVFPIKYGYGAFGQSLYTSKEYYAEDLPALSGTFPVLRVRFGRGPQQIMQVPPVMFPSYKSPALAFDGGSATLSWYYNGAGDCNQDGFVWYDDLLPIGINFNAIGPFPVDSRLNLIDANSNGGVEINDIGFVGAHLVEAVSGYNVYATPDPVFAPVADDMPEEPGIAPVGYVSFADALGTPGVDRLHFSFQLSAPQPGMYLWVQPEYRGARARVRQGQYIQLP